MIPCLDSTHGEWHAAFSVITSVPCTVQGTPHQCLYSRSCLFIRPQDLTLDRLQNISDSAALGRGLDMMVHTSVNFSV